MIEGMSDEFLEFPVYPEDLPKEEKPRVFLAAGSVADIPNGRPRSIQVGSTRVAVFRFEDRVFAIRDNCPHMGADLSMGRQSGASVVCAWHGWSFDLGSGQCLNRDWAKVETYRVRTVGDRLEIEVPVD